MTKKEKSSEGDLSHSSRTLIRHSYEQIVTRVARLSSFASSVILPLWSDVMDRQEQLALDDLVTLSIYVRRAVENSGMHKALRHAKMKTLQTSKNSPRTAEPTPASIIDVINIIIHHQFVHLIRVDPKAESAFSDLRDGTSIEAWLENQKKGIQPAVIIKSDRGGMICFKITTFVDAVMDEIVEPLVEYCGSRGLYLEHLDLD